MGKLRKVLKRPSFLFLWLGQIISQFGDKFAMMALVGLIYKRAPGSAYELAKLFIFIVIPVFIVGPVAGAYSDRWNRKYTMLISDVTRGLLVLLIVLYWKLTPSLKPIFPVYAIVFLLFSVTRFFIPAKMAILPDLVEKDQLLEANSLIHTTGMIAAALGFGVGGVIISLPFVGVKGGLFIDAVTFFLSALLIAFIKTKTSKVTEKEDIHEFNRRVKEILVTTIFTDIKEGIKYLFAHRKMHLLIALLFVLSSGIGAAHVVIMIFIQKTLASITRDLGLLSMFFGAGLFIGSIIYGRYGENIKKSKAIFLSLILGGFFLAQFVIFVNLFANLYTAAIIVFLLGVSVAPILISANTMVHELISSEMRGRTFASIEAVTHLAYIVFMVAASKITGIIKGAHILYVVSAAFIFFGIYGLRRSDVR